MLQNKTRQLIANNIIYFRHKKNQSQEKFAEEIKSSPAYISQLENAKKNVTSDFIDKLADTFDVEPFDLLVKRDKITNKKIDQKK